MQGTDYHFSHLEGKSVWGHQLLATMLECNGQPLIYDITPYDKSLSKIEIVCEIAKSLPMAQYKSYALFDTWFTSASILDTYASRGYHCIGGLKSNRIIYLKGIRTNIKTFAKYIDKADVDLVTVNESDYYVYRYEGALNDIDHAIVLICWPVSAFGNPKAIRAFICTDTELESLTILEYYSKRWSIEFFKDQKVNLGLGSYQVRSSKGIKRLWLLQCLVHLFCTIGVHDTYCKMSHGLRQMKTHQNIESITWIYECGRKGIPMDTVLQKLKAA